MYLKTAMGDFVLPIDIRTMGKHLLEGKVALASDGSSISKNKTATHGWKLHDKNTKSQAYGHGWVSSGGQEMSSLCPEMGGLLRGLAATVHILQSIPRSPSPQRIQLPVYIDNQALISRIRKWKHSGPSGKLHTDFDLLQVIMKVADSHNIDLIPEHVKAHQDNDCAYEDFSWKAKLNCDCDHQATMVLTCIQCLGSPAQTYQLPPGHSASLQIRNTAVTTNMPMAIRNAAFHDDMEKYKIQMAGWDTREIYDMVDWTARHEASKTLRGSRKMKVFKLEFNLLATFRHRNKYDKSVDNRCFRCKRLNEDINHVITCPVKTSAREELLHQAMESAIMGPGACHYVATKMKEGLNQWLNGRSSRWERPIPHAADVVGNLTFKAYLKQMDIGWDQAFKGRVSKLCGVATVTHSKEKGDRDGILAKKWSARVISSLWDMAIKSWIIRNEDLYGNTEQEQLRKLMEEVDSQIKVRYRFDPQRVRESDKSFFLLPMEVSIKQHTLQQKRLWVETVDLAFNAWNNDQSRTMPNVAGSVRLAPVWTRGHGRRPRVRKKPV